MKTKYVDVILKDANNKTLLLKRLATDKMFPGKYCLPGGHVDKGESLLAAAKRECKEETSIDIESAEKLGEFEFDNGESTTVFKAYAGIDFPRASITSLATAEHDSSIWADDNEIEKLKEDNMLAGSLGRLLAQFQ